MSTLATEPTIVDDLLEAEVQQPAVSTDKSVNPVQMTHDQIMKSWQDLAERWQINPASRTGM